MNRKFTTVLAVLAAVTLGVFASGCQKLRARDRLNRGVQAFKIASYPEAVEHFKAAIQLDPTFPTARLYLATAYMQQYIPGAESEENVRMAEAAHDEFIKVLETDPKNEVALASVALLFFNQKKLDEAGEWYNKLIAVAPKNKEAHYTLGVIAWTKSFQPRMELRAKLGMKPEDPGPIRDKKAREELKAKSLAVVEDGMRHLEEALAIDPEYDDSMAYLNLLYRERADLADTPEQYKKDTETADGWVDKTMETKKIKASRSAPTGITAE
jgi:Tfp pilus assembly protein PilF